MTTPEPPPTFITVPSLHVDPAQVRVTDRTADLGTAIVHFSLHATMHVRDAALARRIAAEYTRAAELLEAAEESA